MPKQLVFVALAFVAVTAQLGAGSRATRARAPFVEGFADGARVPTGGAR
jgi:hypothetical protein